MPLMLLNTIRPSCPCPVMSRNLYCMFDIRTEKKSDGTRRRRNRKTSSEDGEEADTARRRLYRPKDDYNYIVYTVLPAERSSLTSGIVGQDSIRVSLLGQSSFLFDAF